MKSEFCAANEENRLESFSSGKEINSKKNQHLSRLGPRLAPNRPTAAARISMEQTFGKQMHSKEHSKVGRIIIAHRANKVCLIDKVYY